MKNNTSYSTSFLTLKEFQKMKLFKSLIILLGLISFSQNLFSQWGTPIYCGQTISSSTIGQQNDWDISDYCINSGSSFNAGDIQFQFERYSYDEVNYITLTSTGNHTTKDLDLFVFQEPLIVIPNYIWTCVANSTRSVACTSGQPLINCYPNGKNVEVIEITNQPPGKYVIIVDGYNSNQEGTFDLSYSCEGLNCTSATELFCGVTRNGSNVGNTNGSSAYDIECFNLAAAQGMFTSGESIYKFTAPETGQYTIDLIANPSSVDLELFIIDQCCPTIVEPTSTGPILIGSNPNCLEDCSSGSTSSTGIETETVTLNAGQEIIIVVDGFLGAETNFNIEVSCQQELNCTDFRQISCGQSDNWGTNNEPSNISEYNNGQYTGLTGSEYPHKIIPTFTGMHTFTLTGVDPGDDLDMFLLDSCDPDDLIESSDGNSPSLPDNFSVSLQAGNTYWLIVDGENGAVSNYTLTVECEEDLNCNTNQNLICGQPFSGTNRNKPSDVTRYDNSTYTSLTGPESVHRFIPPLDGEYTFDLDIADSGDDLDMFLLDSCNPNDLIETSDGNLSSLPDEFTVDLQANNTYFLVVDGDQGDISNYTLNVGCPLAHDTTFCSEQGSGTILYCDDFESYSNNVRLTNHSLEWQTWGNAFSPFIRKENNNQYVSVTWESIVQQQMFNELGNFSNGRYRLAWESYFNTGSLGSYLISHNHNQTNSTINKAFEVKFSDNGTGGVYTENSSNPILNFSYPIEKWFNVVHIIDIDKDEVELFINNEFIGSWQFSVGSLTPVKLLGSVFFTGGTSEFRVDNICFKSTQCNESGEPGFCPQVYDPVCVNGRTISNKCEAECLGYTENEWTTGPCIGCDDCLNCFTYIPEDNFPGQYSFYNNYCPESGVVHKSNSVTSYLWEVKQSGSSATVQFQNNTTATSENPVMKFPSPGTYEVCFKAYYDGTISYECCLPIIVLPTPCYTPPGCHFGATFSNNRFTFNSDLTQGASELRWELPEGMSLINGSAPSDDIIICEWPLPEQECQEICLTAINECGISTYCQRVCSTPSNGCNQVPAQLNFVEPVINGMTVSFPTLNISTWGDKLWKAPGANFINGTNLNSSNPIIEFPDYGNHVICLELYELDGCGKICICWTISLPRPGRCEGPVCEVTSDCGDIEYIPYSGSNIEYVIRNLSGKDICSWEVDGTGIGSGNSVFASFPPDGTYSVCYYYWDYEEWCLKKCCEDFTVPPLPDNCDRNPCSMTVSDCDKFTYNYMEQNGSLNYQFSGTSLAPDEEFCKWEIFSQNNQLINSSSNLNLSYSFSTPGVYEICYYYWNGNCIEKCCRKIYIDDPFQCGDDLVYEIQGDNASFSLNGNFNSISWEDGAGNTGNQNSFVIPIPNQCQERIIKVRYQDPTTGCWYLCCKRVWLCAPSECEDIILYNWNSTIENFEFTLNTSNVSDIEWQIDETNRSFGTGMMSRVPYPVPLPCVSQTISVRYKDSNGRWHICCREIFPCPPVDCEEVILFNWNFNANRFEVSLNAPGASHLEWQIDETGEQFGGNSISNVPIPPQNGPCQERTISVKYRDASGVWRICCKVIRLCPPVDCEESFTYYFNGTTIELKLTESNIDQSSIKWINDTDNQVISTGSITAIPFPTPPSNCVEKWITVQYFDYSSMCWITCCRKIEFCNPLDFCSGTIEYNYIRPTNTTPERYNFRLVNADYDNSKEIVWVDDSSGNKFGSGISASYTNLPSPCRVIPVSVRYFDKSAQVWRICCRLIYVCNSYDCNEISVQHDGGENFTLSIPSRFDEIRWERVGNGSVSGSDPVLVLHDSWRVWITMSFCVYYRDPVTNCYYQCCVEIDPDSDDYCDKPTAGFEFTANGNSGIFNNTSVSTEGNESYSWRFGDGGTSTLKNPTHNFASQIVYNVCLDVTDDCGTDTYCEDVSLVPAVKFKIADNVTGIAGETISVPVSVENFDNIGGFQMSIHVSDLNIGKIVGTSNYRLPNLVSSQFVINSSGNLINLTWFTDPSITLVDNEIIFDLNIELNGNFNQCTNIFIDGNPTEFAAFDNNGDDLDVISESGSACILGVVELSGLVKTEDLDPINCVEINVNGGINQTIKTSESGTYQFSTLTPGLDYNIEPLKNTNPKNGVNIGDVIKIQRFINNDKSQLNSPYKMIAADVNSNQAINTGDLIILQQIINNSRTEFPNNTPSWKFIPESYSFVNPLNPLNESFPQSIQITDFGASSFDENFIGLKMGDVNGTVDPLNGKPTSLTKKGDLIISIPIDTIGEGQKVILPVLATDFQNIAGMQFSIQWDNSILSFDKVTNFSLNDLDKSDFNLEKSEDGLITMSWFTSNGITFDSVFAMFNLEFQVIGNEGDFSVVEISNSPTEIAFFDPNGDDVPSSIEQGGIHIEGFNDVIYSSVITNPLCYDDNDGSISLNINGGSGSYTINWNTGDSDISILSGLSPGDYSATITDLITNDSIQTGTIQLISPDSISLEIIKIRDIKCFGLMDGEAVAISSGGTGTLNYSWESGSTDFTASSLIAGTYSLTVTDQNNCQKVDSIRIEQPEQLALTVNSTFDATSQGTAEANVLGGITPYSYAWSDPQRQTTKIAVNLIPGTYDVTVTDANNCSIIETVIVEGVSSTDNYQLSGGIEIYPNPSNGNFTIGFNSNIQSLGQLNEVNLFSISGQLIEKWDTSSDSAQSNMLLGISKEFVPGIHLIELKFEENTFYKRIVLH